MPGRSAERDVYLRRLYSMPAVTDAEIRSDLSRSRSTVEREGGRPLLSGRCSLWVRKLLWMVDHACAENVGKMRPVGRYSEIEVPRHSDKRDWELWMTPPGRGGNQSNPCLSFDWLFRNCWRSIAIRCYRIKFERSDDVATGNPRTDGQYYSDNDIARMLGISLGRLRNKLSAGSPLPPRIQPPGCRHRLWPHQAVHDWLAQFTVTVSETERSAHEPLRAGRPTNAEVRVRRR